MKGKQPQILRLTTPKLKNIWGPVRKDDSLDLMQNFGDGSIKAT